MQIRKMFKFNNMHVVRNCSSERCKFSLHAHTYEIEIIFSGNSVDNGKMIMDFGLMKGTIKDLIMSFHNSLTVWDKDKELIKEMSNITDRIVITPFSPSAEQFSLYFLGALRGVLRSTEFNNGEGDIVVHSVKVHETRSGYAESFYSDYELIDYKLSDIKFSNKIKDGWKIPNMYGKMIEYIKNNKNIFGHDEKPFKNPVIEMQVIENEEA